MILIIGHKLKHHFHFFSSRCPGTPCLLCFARCSFSSLFELQKYPTFNKYFSQDRKDRYINCPYASQYLKYNSNTLRSESSNTLHYITDYQGTTHIPEYDYYHHQEDIPFGTQIITSNDYLILYVDNKTS